MNSVVSKLNNVVKLDGNQIKDIESFHKHIAKKMFFPSYYGHNLDALYDVLTDNEKINPKNLVVEYTDSNVFFENNQEQFFKVVGCMMHVIAFWKKKNMSFRFVLA